MSAGASSTLYYQGGDCTWRISGIIAGHELLIHSPHIELENVDTGVKIHCEVNGTVLLQANVIHHGTYMCIILFVCVI